MEILFLGLKFAEWDNFILDERERGLSFVSWSSRWLTQVACFLFVFKMLHALLVQHVLGLWDVGDLGRVGGYGRWWGFMVMRHWESGHEGARDQAIHRGKRVLNVFKRFSSFETCQQLLNTYLSIVLWDSISFQSSLIFKDLNAAEGKTTAFEFHGHLIHSVILICSCASLPHFVYFI